MAPFRIIETRTLGYSVVGLRDRATTMRAGTKLPRIADVVVQACGR